MYGARTVDGRHEEKFLGPIFLLTEFSNERKREIVSFTICVNRDEAMNSARLFGTPRHSSTGEVHAWKNLRRRTKTARRVEGGLIVGRADRSFPGLCLTTLSD